VLNQKWLGIKERKIVMLNKRFKTNWIIWLSFVAVIIIQANPLVASIPEPETIVYGQVYNQYQNNKILLTEAEITWSIRKKGSDTLHTYQGEIQCVKCLEFDTNGLNCTSCEKYAYSVKIPQKTDPMSNDSDHHVLPLFIDNQQYDLLEATVNGVKANMRFKSQDGNIQPQDKEGSFILAGQTRRSHYYEVDLELVLPVTDTDNDRIPDFWEKQYHLNINDPSDAEEDTDNDGWNNLEEFLKATDPETSNKIPMLLESDICVFEGTKTLFQLNIADSDTPKEQLKIKFVSIPNTIRLVFHGANTPYKHGHVIQYNDIVQYSHLENGNVFLETISTEKTTDRMYVLLIDGDHDPVVKTVVLNTFKPTSTDGTDAILWTDAYHHAQTNQNTVSKRLEDRSGNDNRGNYYTQAQDMSYVESDIQVLEQGSPAGNPVIKVNGYFELPYATPVFPQGNMTMITVFKVNSKEEDQMIASGSYFEVAISGNSHSLHPGELKIADESKAVYSNKRIDNEWVIATVQRKNGQSLIDINSVWTGGPFSYEETCELANDPIIGGKNIWKWDFNNLQWVSNASNAMDGLFAEMLVFNRPLTYIYGKMAIICLPAWKMVW